MKICPKCNTAIEDKFINIEGKQCVFWKCFGGKFMKNEKDDLVISESCDYLEIKELEVYKQEYENKYSFSSLIDIWKNCDKLTKLKFFNAMKYPAKEYMKSIVLTTNSFKDNFNVDKIVQEIIDLVFDALANE